MIHMITIRQATIEDASIVAHFVDLLLCELSGGPSRLAERQDTTAQLLKQGDKVAGFLAHDGGDAVGVLLVAENHAVYAGGAFGVITELYIAPESRSSGVAQHLIQAAQAYGRERAWPYLEVGAPRQPQWERSLKFYIRQGFNEIGPRLRLKT
ncbi:MAG: GNAT family N-acetyltransferase [Burkholderiaceae bacterium]